MAIRMQKKIILLVALVVMATAFGGVDTPLRSRQRLFQGFDGKTCKVCPSVATDGKGVAILCYTKLLLSGSDTVSGQYISKSTDGGQTWSEPLEMASLRDVYEGDLRIARTAPIYYNRKKDIWCGIGLAATYRDNKAPVREWRNGKPYNWPIFVRFDPNTMMTVGEISRIDFPLAYAGCVPFGQVVEEENGDMLVPFYYETPEDVGSDTNPWAGQGRIVITRCSLEEEGLKILKYGNSIACPELKRGVGEPSLVRFGGKYYMTLRSDEAGMWCESDDGLNFSAPRRWTWTDGAEIGNRNTQQHWMKTRDALYLAYTRETPINGHVFRNRAPVFLAEFKPLQGGLVRDSELVLVPELGARLGNFCCTEDGNGESWLITAEWMQPRGCEVYGSDNSLWLVKIGDKSP